MLSAHIERESKFKINAQLSHFSLIFSGIEKTKKANRLVYNNMKEMLSVLQKNTSIISDEKAQEHLNYVKLIQSDFDLITTLSIQRLRLQNMFNSCLNNCSVTRKLEINDDIEHIKKMIVAVIIGNPILSSKKFENLILDLNEDQILNGYIFPKDKFDLALKEALIDNLQKLDTKNEEIEEIYNGMYLFSDRLDVDKKFDLLVNDHPQLCIDLIESLAAIPQKLSEQEKNFTCQFAHKLKRKLKIDGYISTSIDISLFVLPLLTGPAAPFIEGELMAARLAGWGIKNVGKLAANIKTTGQIVDVTTMGVGVHDTLKLSKKCDELNLKLLEKNDEKIYTQMKSCQKELSSRVLLMELAGISMAVSSIPHSTMELIKGHIKQSSKLLGQTIKTTRYRNWEKAHVKMDSRVVNEFDGEEIVEIAISEIELVSVFDLKIFKDLSDLKSLEASDELLGLVGTVKAQMSGQIKGFVVDQQVDFEHRTKVLTISDRSLLDKNHKLQSGIIVVSSQNENEKLPLEIKTEHKINRDSGKKIYEIKSFIGLGDQKYRVYTLKLFKKAMKVLSGESDVSKVVININKDEKDFYRKLGILDKNFTELNDKSFLIELTPKEMMFLSLE